MTHEGQPIDAADYTFPSDIPSVAHTYAIHLWNLDSNEHDKNHYAMSSEYRESVLNSLTGMNETFAQLDDSGYIQAYLQIKQELTAIAAGTHRQYGQDRPEPSVEYDNSSKRYTHDGTEVTTGATPLAANTKQIILKSDIKTPAKNPEPAGR